MHNQKGVPDLIKANSRLGTRSFVARTHKTYVHSPENIYELDNDKSELVE